MTTFLLLMAGKAGPSWAAGRCSWLEAGEKMDPALSWEPRIPRSQVDFRAEKRSQENCFLFLPVNHSETRDQFAHTSPLSALHLILNLHCKNPKYCAIIQAIGCCSAIYTCLLYVMKCSSVC
ncbi:uncharacterized protein RBU57_009076 isoform 1-T2 [Macrochelys suwanniensis]